MTLKPIALKALAWLHRQRAGFDPQTQQLQLDQVHATALAELALLCFLLRRQSNAYRATVSDLAEVIATVYRRPEFHQAAYFNRHTLIAHLSVRLAVTQKVFDEIAPPGKLSALAGHSAPDLSAVAYRALELAYLLNLNGFLRPPLQLARHGPAFLERTLFNGFGNNADVYAATHAIFYLTDFGRQKPVWLPRQRKQEASAMLDKLLERALESRNWDLVGELILCKKCLGFKRGRMMAAAGLQLGAAQEPGGAICGMSREQLRLDELTAYPTEAKKLFVRLYHPTLATALAGLLIDE